MERVLQHGSSAPVDTAYFRWLPGIGTLGTSSGPRDFRESVSMLKVEVDTYEEAIEAARIEADAVGERDVPELQTYAETHSKDSRLREDALIEARYKLKQCRKEPAVSRPVQKLLAGTNLRCCHKVCR